MAGSGSGLIAGSVVTIDLGPPSGSEAALRRPAVVVTAQEVLDAAPTTVQVVPLTTSLRPFRTEIRIEPGPGSVAEASHAQCQHMRSVSVGRIDSVTGVVSAMELRQIREVLALLLDLT